MIVYVERLLPAPNNRSFMVILYRGSIKHWITTMEVSVLGKVILMAFAVFYSIVLSHLWIWVADTKQGNTADDACSIRSSRHCIRMKRERRTAQLYCMWDCILPLTQKRKIWTAPLPDLKRRFWLQRFIFLSIRYFASSLLLQHFLLTINIGTAPRTTCHLWNDLTRQTQGNSLLLTILSIFVMPGLTFAFCTIAPFLLKK
jgi:hypothetical protein